MQRDQKRSVFLAAREHTFLRAWILIVVVAIPCLVKTTIGMADLALMLVLKLKTKAKIALVISSLRYGLTCNFEHICQYTNKYRKVGRNSPLVILIGDAYKPRKLRIYVALINFINY